MSDGIIVHLPDGSTVSVPTGDPQVAASAARKHWETQQDPAPRSALQTAGDFLGDAVDNFTPNWGDEIAAIPDAAKALVRGEDVSDAFDQGQKQFRDHQDQYDQEHPILAWGSTLTGLGAGLALPAGNLARGASMASRVAHGAAVGGIYGAVAGAGQGDSLGDRATNAGYGAAVGGAFGAGMAPAANAARLAGRWALNVTPGGDAMVRGIRNIPRAVLRRPLIDRQAASRERADRMLASHMGRGNVQEGFGQPGAPSSPEAILQDMERRQQLGVPAIPGDITAPMRNLTSWASRGMGTGQSRVIAALDRRKAEEASRVRQHITDEFGPAVDPIAQNEQLIREASERARPGYEAAYASRMELTPEIEGIMQTPAFQEALPQAVTNIRNAQHDPRAMGFRIGPNGLEGVDTLSTEGFDQVIRAMGDNGQAAMDRSGFRPRNTTNSVHINARAQDLRARLGEQNPAYRNVTQQYADDAAQREALASGQDIGKLTGHEVNAQARHMPENAQASWSLGARSALADSASDFGARSPTGDTAAFIRKQLGDETKQAALGRVTGNPEAMPGLQNRLEAEHQGNILWQEVNGNSKTASRQQLDADLDHAAGKRSLSSLSPRGMLGSVLNHIAAGATAETRNEVKARIAQVATETNPATVRDLMAEVAGQAERDQSFADVLHRGGLLGAKAYATNVKPIAPGAVDEPAPLEVSVWGGGGPMSSDEVTYRDALGERAKP